MSSALDAVLRPRSVAVIGASRTPGTIGHEIVRNLIAYGFEGPVYPVNPKSTHAHSLKTWPDIEAITDPVDLAVIVVPKEHVLGVVEACARKGVKGVVVITAGFREVSAEGRALEDRITQVIRDNGMRMIGPNCMGVINSDPAVSLDASFGTTLPMVGRAAFASQSGALGEVILAQANEVGLGISQFVSLGNKADVSGNDLLEWWAEDEQTQVILLYLESFGNPVKFGRIARKVTRTNGKPILVVKSGRTRQGALAASSHTGALAGGDQAVSSLLADCGVERCNTVGQLFDLALGFCNQPLPAGRRVAVLTNSGGPGIMATDALVHFGLDISELEGATGAALRERLHPEASVRNPVDMIASAGPENYRASAEALLADPTVDALLVLFVSPVIADPPAVARGIVSGVQAGLARAGVKKPVLACFMGRQQGDEGVAILAEAGIPNYRFPETAAYTLAAMSRFRTWRDQPEGVVRKAKVDRDRAAKALKSCRAAKREWLNADEARDVLTAYGIPTAPAERVSTPEQAAAFAERVGYPVVLKIDHEAVIHKSDVGGVQVDLRSEREIKGAFWEIQQRLGQAGFNIPTSELRFLVQKMITTGRETILGAVQDPMVGHLLMFGLGGVFVELMKDVVFRVHPLTDSAAYAMVRTVKGFPLLAGYRGEKPGDVACVEDVLQRISQLVGDFPEVAEMDLNPFLVLPEGQGGVAVDARLRVRAD